LATAVRIERRRGKRTHGVALLALLCMAQFIAVFDINVVIVALPVIGTALGFSQAGLQWVVSSYVLFFAGFLLVAGRMADLFGRRRMFMAGLGLFAAASLACGLARTAAVLLVARAVQGLGAAITAPAALSIITTTFTGRDRNRALGVWTAVAAGGGVVGLVLGGLITDGLGWQWVFLINVPPGIASLVVSLLLVPKDRHRGPSEQVDVLGAMFATAGLTLMVYGLTRVESDGPGFRAAGLVVVAGALLGGFVLTESRVPNPLVPLRTFSSRNLVAASLVAFTLTATTSPTSVLAVIYVQTVLDFSPTRAGFVQLPFSVLVIVGSIIGSKLVSRYGIRFSMAGGLLMIGVALMVMTRISPEAGASYVVGAAALSGMGLGWASVASTGGGTSAVPKRDQGLASGLLNVSAQVGTALGLAVFVTAATLRTEAVAASGDVALVDGYRLAFVLAACMALLAVLAPIALVRAKRVQAEIMGDGSIME
jgi:EmrB/QacA subfamily drug resistance transporter